MRRIAARFDAAAAHGQHAAGQERLLEHALDRLEIELGGQVEHGEILVVEGLDRLRLPRSRRPREVSNSCTMRLDVAVGVHRHEGEELHEARIDAPAGAAIAQRHGGDEVALEPGHRRPVASSLTLVGLTRVSTGPAIRVMLHGCAGLLVLGHQRDGRQHLHAGLAHAEHVRAGPDLFEEADDVVDVVVEAEGAVGERRRRGRCASR